MYQAKPLLTTTAPARCTSVLFPLVWFRFAVDSTKTLENSLKLNNGKNRTRKILVCLHVLFQHLVKTAYFCLSVEPFHVLSSSTVSFRLRLLVFSLYLTINNFFNISPKIVHFPFIILPLFHATAYH